LASFLFGGTPTPGLREAVWRAYLDLSRTVHNIAASDPSGGLRKSAHQRVEKLLTQLVAAGPRDEGAYDSWHRQACTELGKHFASGGFPNFAVGQSQKWLNMAVKYTLTLAAVGWQDVPAADQLRTIAHAPVDSFFLKGLARHSLGATLPVFRTTWSRLSDYEEYFRFQRALRDSFGCPPLDLEFHVWQAISAERRALEPPSAL
jgi:hypothetical protein